MGNRRPISGGFPTALASRRGLLRAPSAWAFFTGCTLRFESQRSAFSETTVLGRFQSFAALKKFESQRKLSLLGSRTELLWHRARAAGGLSRGNTRPHWSSRLGRR